MIGKTILHYHILEKLGEGGNGVVYRAEDLKLKRTVALKFLSYSYALDADAKKRFIHEAQSASALDHPNIYTIHEIGETEDGKLFISMTHYEGENLKDKIKKGRLNKEQVINIAIQICEGLNKAHQSGIIHRDIKPANIFVTKDGIVKILDFGLAKVKGGLQLTKEGTTVGTVAYMSPEQARGEEADNRTDIWSLGVVMFEMLTGVLPFNADYDQAIIYSILNRKPDLSTVPKEFVPFLKKTLAKIKNERYLSIEEALKDLRLLKSGLEIKHFFLFRFPAQVKVSFRTKLVAAIVLIFIAASFIYLKINRAEVNMPRVPKKNMIVVLPFENLGSPDDNYFAEGIADELTSRLSSIGEISVISSKSAKRFSNSKKSIKDIGGELGADYVLVGTIRWARKDKSESRVKIIPELILVSDNTVTWSYTYNKVVDDIFSVQNEITQNVAEKISGKFISPNILETANPTDNMGAYTYYLKGIDYENRWYVFKEDFLKRVNLFEKAIELDPKFTQAYAHLSIAKSGMYGLYFDHSEKTQNEASYYAQKAFRLNPNLADVHFALGYYYGNCEQNFEKAINEYNIVLKVNPNNADTYSKLGGLYSVKGNYQLAIQNMKKASTLDPLSIMLLFNLAETYRIMRDYINADKYYKRAIELNPELPFSKAQLAMNDIDWKGDTKTAYQIINNLKAIDEDYYNYVYAVSVYIDVLNRNYDGAINKLMPLNKDTVNELMGYTLKKLELGLIYKFKNDEKLSTAYFDSTRIQIEKMYRANPNDNRLLGKLGIAYAGLGNKEKALEECKKSIELHQPENNGAEVSGILSDYGSQWDLARVYILLGDYEKALHQIDYLLSIPGDMTLNKLKLDPIYDPLRNLPGYKNIIEKYSADI